MKDNTVQDRYKLMIFSLDQLVSADSFSRVIDDFVDALDMSSFDFDHAPLKNKGRPSYAPAMMLKLYLYGYHYNIRSSRKLARAAQINTEVMWLLNGLRPHYKTIANFRKNNAESLRKVLMYFISTIKD